MLSLERERLPRADHAGAVGARGREHVEPTVRNNSDAIVEVPLSEAQRALEASGLPVPARAPACLLRRAPSGGGGDSTYEALARGSAHQPDLVEP